MQSSDLIMVTEGEAPYISLDITDSSQVLQFMVNFLRMGVPGVQFGRKCTEKQFANDVLSYQRELDEVSPGIYTATMTTKSTDPKDAFTRKLRVANVRPIHK